VGGIISAGKLIGHVAEESIAGELGLHPGDRILCVNGEEPGDILDWRLAESAEELLLVVRHRDGSLAEYDIEKDYHEPLGLQFDPPTLDPVRSCRNRCLFCFVDQMPAGMRSSLYLKDDDYRLSFCTGSFITLTNLTPDDLDRICRLHLSPLYVSVHATESGLRSRMLGNRRAGEIMQVLSRLVQAGIRLHAQVVLCPGLNGGAALERTIDDLYSLYPAVQSLAVVPVGLTAHRAGLYPLEPCRKADAEAALALVNAAAERALGERGTRFVFAADELYLLAGHSVPGDEVYESYPQLENGVGLVRLLLNEWEAWQDRLPRALQAARSATVVTGLAAAGYMHGIVARLNEIHGLSVRLAPVPNRFFGGHVSVAGLLTAADLLAAFAGRKPQGTLFLPGVMLKDRSDLFLDGYTLPALSADLGAPVRVANCLDELLCALLGAA
jgi:putative radical SAM enzyme (TIGR03279 family)